VVLGLPGEAGLLACTALKAWPGTARVPVMLLSAAQYPDSAAAASVGADLYLSMPFDTADLLGRAASLVDRPVL
jgi:DNA-binding response OmpR family regulator